MWRGWRIMRSMECQGVSALCKLDCHELRRGCQVCARWLMACCGFATGLAQTCPCGGFVHIGAALVGELGVGRGSGRAGGALQHARGLGGEGGSGGGAAGGGARRALRRWGPGARAPWRGGEELTQRARGGPSCERASIDEG